MTDILKTSNLKAYYITRAYGVQRTVKAVDGISLAIRENEILGIAGESGCGKSTLLKVLLGMVKPPLKVVGGSVTYDFYADPRDVLTLTESELRAMRWKEISYIPQGSMNVLNPVRRIRDTFRDFISVHLRIRPRARWTTWFASYLSELGLPDKVLNSYPAPAFRRHAPAGDDRPGDHPLAQAHPGRRADHRARRGGAARRDPAAG